MGKAWIKHSKSPRAAAAAAAADSSACNLCRKFPYWWISASAAHRMSCYFILTKNHDFVIHHHTYNYNLLWLMCSVAHFSHIFSQWILCFLGRVQQFSSSKKALFHWNAVLFMKRLLCLKVHLNALFSNVSRWHSLTRQAVMCIDQAYKGL